MWVQKVYQVDDSPRYECSAPWIRYSERIIGNAMPMPPCLEENLRRGDYDILKRTNRHEMKPGHIHEKDNIKVLKRGGMTNLVMEKGLNTYERVANSNAKAPETGGKSTRVTGLTRKVWDEVFERKETLLSRKVDGKSFGRNFSTLMRFTEAQERRALRVRSEIRETIQEYLK